MEINQVLFERRLCLDFVLDCTGYFERFNAWKSVNKNLKTLLAVGGWVGENFFGENTLNFNLGYGNERFRRDC